MKARWSFESVQPPIHDLSILANELQLCAGKDPTALPLVELLGNVQHHGGWRGEELRTCGLLMIFEHVDDPDSLRLIHDCDSSIFEGEDAAILWAAALATKGLSLAAIESILRDYERPATLGGAPFEWFVANHSDWPPEILKRYGVNPECEAPPLPRFFERLLAYDIPATERVLFEQTSARFQPEDMRPRSRLLKIGQVLTDEVPLKSIMAGLAQEVLSERFDPERDWVLANSSPLPLKFTSATQRHFCVQSAIDVFSTIWMDRFLPSEERSPAMRAEFESALLDWIPEIREDARFLWAIEAKISRLIGHGGNELERLDAAPPELIRSFKRLRGENAQKKPIMHRDYLTGAELWPSMGSEAQLVFTNL